MDDKELKHVLESILFAVGEPISYQTIAENLEQPPSSVKSCLEELKNEYDYEMRGIRIVRMEQKYQMTTRSEYFDTIKKVLKNYAAGTLSQAALETLAIIAYRQPVTRADIEQIRGVQSSSSLDLLIDKGLVRTAGKLDIPGKPIAFETTIEFLKLLNIEKLSYLPDYAEFANGVQLALDENLNKL